MLAVAVASDDESETQEGMKAFKNYLEDQSKQSSSLPNGPVMAGTKAGKTTIITISKRKRRLPAGRLHALTC